jgi:hypothetical protein
MTVKGLNGVLLSGLATGILKNTTITGDPSIAVAGDFPTLNQNTTGAAESLTHGFAPSLTQTIWGATPATYINGVCTATMSSTTVSCTGASFNSSTDVGKTFVQTAGYGQYVTTIASVTNSTTFVAAAAPTGINYSGGYAYYGFDNTAVFNAAGATSNISRFQLPTGQYYIVNGAVTWSYGQVLEGAGPVPPPVTGGIPTVILCTNPTAVCMDWELKNAYGQGPRELSFYGPHGSGNGSSATGIGIGLTSGATWGFKASNILVENFDVGMNIHTDYMACSNCNISNNIVDIIDQGGETHYFDHLVADGGGPDFGVTNKSNCIEVTGFTFALTIEGSSVVECQIAVSGGGNVRFNNSHMEDGNGTAQPYWNITSGLVEMNGVHINVGSSATGTAPTSFAALSGGTLNIKSGSFTTELAATPVVAVTSGTQLHIGVLQGIGSFTNVFTGSDNSAIIDPQPAYNGLFYGSNTTLSQYATVTGCTAAVTLTLPSLPASGQIVTVFNAFSTGNCTVSGNGNNIVTGGGAVSSIALSPLTGATFTYAYQGGLAQWYATGTGLSAANSLFYRLWAVGTVTAGKLACFTSGFQVGNCTATAPSNFLGVFLSATGNVATQGTVANLVLDASSNVAAGDYICVSTTVAGESHENGTTTCPLNQLVGIAQTTQTGVTSATVFLKLQ